MTKTPPTPEDYGLTTDRVKWLSRHIQKLESWEDAQDTKTNQVHGSVTRVLQGLVVGALVGLFFSFCVSDIWTGGVLISVIGAIVGAVGVSVELMQNRTPPVQISDDERYGFSDYQKALRDWEYQQKSYWTDASGMQFEKRLTKLLNNRGWTAKTTKASGDGGYDIVATCPQGTLYWIQCKNWAKKCGVEPIRLLAGTLSIEGTTAAGIVACTGGFTASGEASARKAGILLWDLAAVMTLVNTPQ